MTSRASATALEKSQSDGCAMKETKLMLRGSVIGVLCLILTGILFLTPLFVAAAANETRVADAAMKGDKDTVRSLIQKAVRQRRSGRWNDRPALGRLERRCRTGANAALRRSQRESDHASWSIQSFIYGRQKRTYGRHRCPVERRSGREFHSSGWIDTPHDGGEFRQCGCRRIACETRRQCELKRVRKWTNIAG